MRILEHPILGPAQQTVWVDIEFDGKIIKAREGETIAAALMAAGKLNLRYTRKRGEPRGVFCGIGRCTDCIMTVDGQPNVRTCITKVKTGMKINTPGVLSPEGAN